VQCAELRFRVAEISTYEPDQRIVTIRFEGSGPLESARALFEWSYGNLEAGTGRPPNPGKWAFVSFLDGRGRRSKGTSPPSMRDAAAPMKRIAQALQAYQVDYNHFPAGDISNLARGVFLYYLGERLDTVDPWGNRYDYRSNPRGHCVLASAGPDGVFQTSPEELSEFVRSGPAGRLPVVVEALADDLIVCDGVFLRGVDAAPIAAPAEPIAVIRCKP
jgi:hypothetical protein